MVLVFGSLQISLNHLEEGNSQGKEILEIFLMLFVIGLGATLVSASIVRAPEEEQPEREKSWFGRTFGIDAWGG